MCRGEAGDDAVAHSIVWSLHAVGEDVVRALLASGGGLPLEDASPGRLRQLLCPGGGPLGSGGLCGGPWRTSCSRCRLRAGVVLPFTFRGKSNYVVGEREAEERQTARRQATHHESTYGTSKTHHHRNKSANP